MRVAPSNRKSFSETSNTVNNTIDQILNRGAEKLYDKYIYSKVPSDLSGKLTDLMSVIFDPITNPNQERILKKDQKIHESVITKINLANEAKMSKNCSNTDRNSRIHQSLLDKSNLGQSRQAAKARKSKNGQNNTEVKPQAESKKPPALKKLLHDNGEHNESLEIIRVDKAKRYNEEKQMSLKNKQLFQKTQRHREQLQQELKQLAQNNQTLAFDYETCRIIVPEPVKMPPQKSSKSKPNMIFLKFQMEDGQHKVKNSVPKEKEIKNIRKITSFERGRRSKHHEVDNESYNNNGERQFSTIPYIEIEEGVKMTETTGNKVAERPQTSRRSGTASTHRTFKSYTRERFESLGAFRTIDVIGSAGNNRYLGQQSKESKRTANQTPKRSLLWSSRTCAKDHRISKNLEHFGAFFEFLGETVE